MRCWILVFVLMLCPGFAAAEKLSGTLRQINDTGVIKLGYHEEAEPFSFVNPQGTPVGYSLDLCRRIVEATKRRLNRPDLKTEFVLVNYENRFDAVESGKVDLECGTSTITLSRMQRVDFSLMTFVTGGTLVSSSKSPLLKIEDSVGRRIAVIKGATAEKGLQNYLRSQSIDAEIVTVKNGGEGMQRVVDGDVDAFANDQVTLIGQIIRTRTPEDFSLARGLFSFEPYGLTLRKNDSDFRLVVNTELARLYRSGQVQPLFGKWFARVGIEPSEVLVAMYSLQSLPE